MLWWSVALGFVGLLFAPPALGEHKPKTCLDVKNLYSNKGFSVTGVPATEISGEHLRICPQGYTCCTSDMEVNLAMKSKNEFESLVKDSSRSVQNMLMDQHSTFDSYFHELLDQSEKNLHKKIQQMHRQLYTDNVKTFKDLFNDLRRYYKGANINLEEALNEFWTRLMERLFRQHRQLKSQHQITDDYLECMVKQAEQMKPFGDVPRYFKIKLTRVLIAARSFVQGLSIGSDVVKKVSQVSASPECMRAMMRLMYCPHCRSMASIKPCNNYCLNIMKGCLANQADLDSEWRNLIDSMIHVADRFDGPSNMESFVDDIDQKISEAIVNMENRFEHILSKVQQGCGHLKSTADRSPGDNSKRRSKRHYAEDKMGSSIAPQMDRLVTEVKMKLRDVKEFWINLPGEMCRERVTAGSANEDECWNGQNRGRYLPEVMSDGLANQINNPEVEVDITKPDMTIRQQIMQLRIMTNRLRNAYHGNDIDFQDTSDDSSGSGSGDGCSENACSRKRSFNAATSEPLLYPKPKPIGKNSSNSISLSLYSTFFHLLSVALAVQYFWR
ncbi:glypican-1b [Callorhinchus milii]|uniref:Glypican-1 n=1 Tax=Callorhinchus milii TaxID=7868 RepID=A0A4W3IVM8_CALMI|nr:glypican-1b [Callorhinchus milii]|eukprot:gi/632934317/ref/XP_007907526.1/ PREDICTED: glypican-1-like [Callorhinchus milii]